MTTKRCEHLRTCTCSHHRKWDQSPRVGCFQHVWSEVEPSHPKQHMRHTHRKRASALVRQPSLQHKCKTDVLLISPSLYWPLREQLQVETKTTFSIHTHQPQKMVANLTQNCCQVQIVERWCPTKWGEMVSWGDGQTGSRRRWHPALSWPNCKMGRSTTRAKEVQFVPQYCRSLQLWWPLREEHATPLPEETQALYRIATEDYLTSNATPTPDNSAVRLLTASRRSALKVKQCSADHTQDHFTHTPNPHIYLCELVGKPEAANRPFISLTHRKLALKTGLKHIIVFSGEGKLPLSGILLGI